MRAEVFCPAKINLYLNIEGRRADGYHELTSLVAPLDFGDRLTVQSNGEVSANTTDGEADSLQISGLPLHVDSNNLILRAARLYREKVAGLPALRWLLDKQIPWGAGLGGGSSNAAGALRLLQQFNPNPLPEHELLELAAMLGADVPLFLRGGAGWMRGKGELWQPLQPAEQQEIKRWRVLLFSPGFEISTVWAYRTLAQHLPHLYLKTESHDQWQQWQNKPSLPELLYNTLESVAGSKYLAIPVLLDKIKRELGVPCLMSGSGSCCFALLGENQDSEPISALIRENWGREPIGTIGILS